MKIKNESMREIAFIVLFIGLVLFIPLHLAMVIDCYDMERHIFDVVKYFDYWRRFFFWLLNPANLFFLVLLVLPFIIFLVIFGGWED